MVFNLSLAFLLISLPSLVSPLFKAHVTQALDQDPATWRGFLASTKPALVNHSFTVCSTSVKRPRLESLFAVLQLLNRYGNPEPPLHKPFMAMIEGI
jgi:hypothetical protein